MPAPIEVPFRHGRRWVYTPISRALLDELKAIEAARPSPEFLAYLDGVRAFAAGVPFTREGDKLTSVPCAIILDGAQTKVFYRPQT